MNFKRLRKKIKLVRAKVPEVQNMIANGQHHELINAKESLRTDFEKWTNIEEV